MNFFREDPNLSFILKQYLEPDMLDWATRELDSYGELCGTEIDQRAVHTDREGQPRLIKYDQMGNDISHVWLNEGYKKTVEQTYNSGIVGLLYKEIPALKQRGNYIYSYAQGYLLSQAEPGFYCPVTLTMATAYLLDQYADQALKEKYLPHVTSMGEVELYEGATFLTERQGGSDVGANDTKAVRSGDNYRLYGEKYFASNGGACGVAMVLARMEGAGPGTRGLSLFLVPWRKADGTLNHLQIRRVKDKLGVRAVPSVEVVLEGSEAYLVGDASKGFYYMMEALNLSRVCNAVASVGIMRRAYIEARNYAFKRDAFGRKLADFPMVKETLSVMSARQEVETGAIFSIIPLFERVMRGEVEVSQEEMALNRLLIALLKMRTAEAAIEFSHQAIEMHGGNGYIEDFVTPRLLRDAQVLTVWEGTANILGLEVLRLIHKFNVHQSFLAQVQAELAKCKPELEHSRKYIDQGIGELIELLTYLAEQNEDAQTYHSKRVAHLMSDIYTSTIALRDANQGDARKEKIARLHLEHTWNKQHRDEEMLPLAYFAEVVGS
ncbi:acyl-CoA dehydrogenase family protein [Brevibacillus sp. SYSU BS000544]|uniref:acyl-CoA dehydrogenase family protein n=1 Tax=Brevibacillus sp. SYSU BS000544 TaxID=3416443 RepID=UPI003CE53D77